MQAITSHRTIAAVTSLGTKHASQYAAIACAQLRHSSSSTNHWTSNNAHNAFITYAESKSAPTALPSAPQSTLQPDDADHDRPLAGLSIALKDNICTTALPTTCASAGLAHYHSPYDATVVTRLVAAGAHIAGKTNLDEFGMGSHTTHSAFGRVRGIFSSDAGEPLSAGGSSGGSAVAVAAGACDAALGTDTGGSVRLPAAWSGVYGFKPSYGRVSRWGVVAYANSLDTVGVLARDLGTLGRVCGVLDAFDERDPTSLPMRTRAKLGSRERPTGSRALRFGIPRQYVTAELTEPVRRAWTDSIRHLRTQGHSIHSVSLPTTRQALSAYYILAPAEASSNLAKYDGARYGTPPPQTEKSSAPLYAASRQHGFGDEVRRRILLGSYSLSADAIDNYFIKAQKIRRLVQRDFDDVFTFRNPLTAQSAHPASDDNGERVDALLCPTAPDLPPSIESVESQSPIDAYAGDVFTVPASLAGLPALNVPVKIRKLSATRSENPDSAGIQIITQYGDDDLALAVGLMLEPLG